MDTSPGSSRVRPCDHRKRSRGVRMGGAYLRVFETSGRTTRAWRARVIARVLLSDWTCCCARWWKNRPSPKTWIPISTVRAFSLLFRLYLDFSSRYAGTGFTVTGGENFVVPNVNKSSKPGSCSAGNFKLSINPLRADADVWNQLRRAHGQTALWGSDLFFSRSVFFLKMSWIAGGDVACLGFKPLICSLIIQFDGVTSLFKWCPRTALRC